ncbi:hypothetical protein ACSBQ3_02520 [Staphylococcus equorum]|uniref:hypothetical protein n=1 Tax=Staphylococcus equorum TaxID=246432 RepID=UPI003EB7CE61
MGKKKTVKIDKTVKNNVANNKNVKNTFKIVISNKEWLKSCKIKSIKFTNKYNDYEEMAQILTKVMTTLITDIQENGYDIFHKQGIFHSRYHSHTIDGDKKVKVEKIIQEIYPHPLDIDSDEEKKLWQYGVTGGVRLICLFDQANCEVHPLFIDPFHLIYPNEKHNQIDVMSNNYCPIESFN